MMAASEAAIGRNHAARNCVTVAGLSMRARTRAVMRVARKSSPSYRNGFASVRKRSKNLSSVIVAPVEVCQLFLKFPPREGKMRTNRPLAQIHHRCDFAMIELLHQIETRHDVLICRQGVERSIDARRQLSGQR